MKNIPNVLALSLSNLDLVSVNVAVTLHRHNSMLDTNEIMIVMRRGPKTNRTSRSANHHMIIVEKNKAYYDGMSAEVNASDVCESATDE